MYLHFKSPIILLAILGMTACEAGINDEPAQPLAYAECEEPRPQFCTQEYVPVCGTRDTGVRCVTTPCPSTEQRTYGNACSACAEPDVLGFERGECIDMKDAR